jgi:hypothetical protein
MTGGDPVGSTPRLTRLACRSFFISEHATAFAQLLTRSDQCTVTGRRPAIFVEAFVAGPKSWLGNRQQNPRRRAPLVSPPK